MKKIAPGVMSALLSLCFALVAFGESEVSRSVHPGNEGDSPADLSGRHLTEVSKEHLRELFQGVLEEQRLVLGRESTEESAVLAVAMSIWSEYLEGQKDLPPASELESEVLRTLEQIIEMKDDGLEELISAIARQELSLKSSDVPNVAELRTDSYLSTSGAEEAIEIFEKTLNSRRRVLGNEHPDTLGTMLSLAEVKHRSGQVVSARLLLEDIRASRVRAGPEIEMSAAHLLGLLYRDLGDPEESARLLLDALRILETQTLRAGDTEALKSSFRARFAGFYWDPIEALLTMGQAREAFHVLERFRAQGFLRTITDRVADHSEIPPHLEARRRQLAKLYDAATRERYAILEEGGRGQVEAVLERQREIRRERERIDAELRRSAAATTSPDDPRSLSVEEVRRVLEPGTLMLSYLVGRDQTLLFTLSRDSSVQVHRIKVGEEGFRKQVSTFFGQHRVVTKGLRVSNLRMGQWLYSKLIAPAEKEIHQSERLLIVADGPLHYLSFSALVRPGGQRLVEWKPIHSTLSATVYAQLQAWRPEPDRADDRLQLAAFGDPIYPGDRRGLSFAAEPSAIERGIFGDLAHLPYTAYEVREISQLFPAGSALTFLGSEATEENAKAIGETARIIHFAAHSDNDPFTQLDSFIALSLIDDQEENGLLQAWEIYESVRLDADLVVLSACQTAFGPETDGEGLMSLSRAFQVAGARTVMASLWSVNDASTAELMIRFYRHLHAGKSKDEALRAAQMEFIQGPIEIDKNGRVVDYSAPYHWAAFQVIGDWQ